MVRDTRRRAWLRGNRGPTAADMERAADRVREALAGGATVRRTELEALVGKPAAHGVGLWVDLVRAAVGHLGAAAGRPLRAR